MIDLHIHVLPGIDDGARNLDEALEMCRMCAEGGVRAVVATPHLIPELYDNTRESVLASVEDLRAALRSETVALEILPGADVRLEHDLADRIESGEVCTVNDGGKYLLIEIPETLTSRDFTRPLAALRRMGVRPVVSHPERNPYFVENPEALYNLVYSDVLLQITGRSLLGGFGKTARTFSERLLRHRLVHVIASDAHSATMRRPGLRAAYERASEIIGEDEARRLVRDNPECIVSGRPVRIPEPVPWEQGRKGWWRFGL